MKLSKINVWKILRTIIITMILFWLVMGKASAQSREDFFKVNPDEKGYVYVVIRGDNTINKKDLKKTNTRQVFDLKDYKLEELQERGHRVIFTDVFDDYKKARYHKVYKRTLNRNHYVVRIKPEDLPEVKFRFKEGGDMYERYYNGMRLYYSGKRF